MLDTWSFCIGNCVESSVDVNYYSEISFSSGILFLQSKVDSGCANLEHANSIVRVRQFKNQESVYCSKDA